MSKQETTNQHSTYSIGRQYDASVLFEISVNTCGNNYLVIYGKHVNGYFCCIPNWNVGCEMAEPSDVFYNRSRLVDDACLGMNAADAIAKAIKNTSDDLSEQLFIAKYETPGDNEEFATIFAKDMVEAYKEAEEMSTEFSKLILVYTEEEYKEIYCSSDETEE